jgi:hypothetical protein
MDLRANGCWELCTHSVTFDHWRSSALAYVGHIMATRQRGSNSRGSSKQRFLAAQGNQISPPEPAIPQHDNQHDSYHDRQHDSERSEREQRIAHIAYLRAAERGFEPGHELDDWLAAEREIEGHGTGRDGAAHPV